MTDEQITRNAPADVNELLERIDAGWRALMQALDGIPDDRFDEPGVIGAWSLKDLFGHLAFWDDHAIQEIERALAGLPREDAEWQAMNEADHAARAGRTLPEQRAAMHQAHAEMVARLEDVAGLDAGPIDAAIRPDTYDHYAEHVPDIERWRQRQAI
jgi:hypothetical protein